MQQETQEIVHIHAKREYEPGKGMVETTIETPITAYRSRWGWHPISREDFQILKAVHKRYWETLREAYQWARWFRKAPQNRVLFRKLRNSNGQVIGRDVVGEWEEPTVDPLFISKDGECSFYTRANGGCSRGHYLPFRPLFGTPPASARQRKIGINMVADFKRARTPVASPQDLVPLDMEPYRAVWEKMTAAAV